MGRLPATPRSLQFHISTLLVAMVIVVGAVVATIGYYRTSDLIERDADRLLERNQREALGEIERLFGPARVALDFLHRNLADAPTLQARAKVVALLRAALDASPALTSAYVAQERGDFFLLRRLRGTADREQLAAPENAAYVVQLREPDREGRFRGRYLYLNSRLEEIAAADRPDFAAFEPQTRPWYREAIFSEGPIRTRPYVFFTTRAVGATIAWRTPDLRGVVALDVEIADLSKTLGGLKTTPSTEVALMDADGRLVAYPDESRVARSSAEGGFQRALIGEIGVAPLSALAARLPSLALDKVSPGQVVRVKMTLADGDWRVGLVRLAQGDDEPLFLASIVPDDELLRDARKAQWTMLSVAALFVLLCLPLSLLVARALARPLKRLAEDVEAVKRFDFSTPERPRTIVSEVKDLREAVDSMKATIRRFLSLTSTVAAEDNFERLLPRLLDETISATGATAGLLYLLDNSGAGLVQASARAPGKADLAVSMPRLTLENADAVLSGAISARQPGRIRVAAGDPAAVPLAPLFVALGIRDLPCVAMPLANRKGELLGLMLLAFDRDAEDYLVRFVGELSATAAVSLETRQLLGAQKALFEAFIQLIANAIDAKSPYTGGHCERVPELTKMLARAACDATEGPFREFSLSEEEWEAVHVAAWLHDCGKVTTPEYVVDKATKLETLYDRIHEVRMRFEVLKRDAEISYWRAVAAGGDPAALRAQLDAAHAALDDDFAFVAECNEGGEFMAPDRVERLRAIAARTWQRTLDDRIGISHEEKERKERAPAAALPAMEPLLADRPEHRIERRPQDRMPEDNPWGFRLKVPELLYDRGELHNLAVSRGTLADEDRYKINEHIVQTIVMLSQLPYPRHLRSVPEIAGGHHEKMDGTGYPKRLSRDDMSPVARMMAIADIFEALTAVDRPYKKGKTLSESVKIMSMMKKDRHIDPELFDLFLTSGVYLEYARRYMKPEQIDPVDVADYLTRAA